MNAILRCGKCGNDTVVTSCNLARVTMKCPVTGCGFPNSLLQMLENFYGDTVVNKELKKDIDAFNRAKANDNYPSLLARVDAIVQAAIDKASPLQAKS
jgi:hypothetical protein